MKKNQVLFAFFILIGIFLIVFPIKCFAETSNLLPTARSNTTISLRKGSALVPLNSGYMRVFYDSINQNIGIEYYDDNFKVLEKKKVNLELDIYGGFYAGKDAYYIVEGQTNEEEDDNKEVIRVIKYNTKWEKIGSTKITSNTIDSSVPFDIYSEIRYPFDHGCVEMTESNGKLYIVTGHEGYVDNEIGQGHQGFLMIEVDETTLEGKIVDADLWHSFAQYIENKDNYLYVLEQSEGSGFTKLTRYNEKELTDSKSVSVLEYGGDRTGVWAIDCYASVDGMAISQNSVLTIGSSIDQSQYDYVTDSTPYNIYLGITPINNFSTEATQLKWLTNYNGEGYSFSGIGITKINDNKFMVSWKENNETENIIDNDTLSTSVLHYVFIDGNGNKLGKEYKVQATFSDCKPIIKNNKAVFYSSSNTMIDFYIIDLNTYNFDKVVYRVAGENVTWDLDNNGIFTISGNGELTSNVSGSWRPIRSLVKKINIKEGVVNVPDEEFKGFTSLTQVVLPKSMKKIGISAFENCGELKTIYLFSNVESIGTDALWSGSYWFGGGKVYNATVYTIKGAYAEKWAKENGVSYKYIQRIPFVDQLGWIIDGKTWYYYDENGDKTVGGKYNINNCYYWFDENGKMITTGWYKDKYQWYWINPNGDCAIGWKKISGKWYYFDEEAKMYSNGSKKINGKVYLFEDEGNMLEGTGWYKKMASSYYYWTNWYYLKNGGENTFCQTGWMKLGNTWYYLDENTGRMENKSCKVNGKIELFELSGAWIDSSNINGWFKHQDFWYYGKNGKLLTGWQYINNVWYYFREDDGIMYSGTEFDPYSLTSINNKDYCFDQSGAMQTGWVKIKLYLDDYSYWYYFGSDGASYKNKWLNYKGYDYYFDASGIMVSDCNYSTKDGYYRFDKEGRCMGKVN